MGKKFNDNWKNLNAAPGLHSCFAGIIWLYYLLVYVLIIVFVPTQTCVHRTLHVALSKLAATDPISGKENLRV